VQVIIRSLWYIELSFTNDTGTTATTGITWETMLGVADR